MLTAGETILRTPDRTTDGPGLAMIGNVLTPYRINLHKLIAEGIPELKLHTLVTHGPADFDWAMDTPGSIHASFFATRGDSPLSGTFRHPISEWKKATGIIEYLKENDIRAVIMTGYRYISYLRTIRYCGATGLPLFINMDSNIHGDRRMPLIKRWAKKRLYAWWLRRSSGIMSMGEYGDRFFLYYGARLDRLYRMPYWPDFDAFSQVDAELLNRFRRKYGLNPTRKYMLYSGRLVPQKRVDLLIDAFAALAPKRPDWDLLIVGDGVLHEELKQRIPAEFRQRVVWTGFLETKELSLAYHAAEVLVLPSDFEPWALVVQEAMAAGLTVVASDIVGAARELIIDGVSGRIFTASDCDSLIDNLEDVTQQECLESYKQQSVAALNRYRQQVDPVAEVRRALSDAGVLTHAADR